MRQAVGSPRAIRNGKPGHGRYAVRRPAGVMGAGAWVPVERLDRARIKRDEPVPSSPFPADAGGAHVEVVFSGAVRDPQLGDFGTSCPGGLVHPGEGHVPPLFELCSLAGREDGLQLREREARDERLAHLRRPHDGHRKPLALALLDEPVPEGLERPVADARRC